MGETGLTELWARDPRQVGPYVLLGRLGHGRMGRVYLARAPSGRTVAVKVIWAQLAESASFRARFIRQVAAARKVSGLFTAQVIDADIDGPILWLVTAYVPGGPLSEAVEQQGPLPESSVPKLAAGLAEGLSAIHAAGVIHWDLRPSHVLLAPDGPRIIDFGISLAAEATVLTAHGREVYSAEYMSPEQIIGNTVGPASDMFSLASVLIYAARGDGPFDGAYGAGGAYRVAHRKPNIDKVPGRLRPLLQRCLSRDPGRRPTATQFLAELSAAYPAASDLTNWLPGNGHVKQRAGGVSVHPLATPDRIFLSYRRDDTAYPCGWLYDKLTHHFGRDRVFKDIDSIELGDDFTEVITTAVEQCAILIALIGQRWLSACDGDGRRRLDNPTDFVRLEIEAAITRNVRIIPVLVEGVRMPRVGELPASLAMLTRRQALELSSSHFDSGIQRLLRVLDDTFTSMRVPPE